MPEATQRYDLDRVVRLVLTAAGAVALFWLVRTLADVLLPFFVAVLLAYLLHPIVTLVERRIRNRTAAVLLTVAAVLILVASFLALIVPLVGSEMGRFEGTLSQIRDESSAAAARLRVLLQEAENSRLGWLVEQLRTFLVSEDFRAMLARGLQALAPTARGVLAGAVSAILAMVGALLVLLYLIFLLIDYRDVSRTWKDYLPPAYKPAILDFLEEFHIAMRRYFRGQFVVATITGVLFAIGFRLIGLPLGILLGLLTGLLNMVPYLQAIALVPAAMLALVRAIDAQSSILVSFALVLAVFAAVQVLMDGFLTPRIMGSATGLRPVVIMLSVFIWGRLLGFVGLVLAIPLTCMGLAYYRRFVLTRAPAPIGATPHQAP